MRSFLILSAIVIFSPQAHAARTARVIAESTVVVERPIDNAKVLRKIRKNTPLVVSNFPTESYHKVRLADGTLGWVKTLDLTLGELPEEYR